MSNLQKVKSGDPLKIPAATFNTFVDAARDYKQRTQHIGQKAEPSFRQASIVLVRNDSGSDLNRLAVLGIDAPIITPTDNADEFKNRVALACITPAADTHEGKFVVLAEPIATGQIGRAYAAGVCPVKIDVPDEDTEYPFAEIADTVTDNLKAAHHGSAAILWREGGTGVQWAVVRIGAKPPTTEGFWAQLTGSTADGTNRWSYSFVEVYKATAGYGGWATTSGGKSGTARNTIEDGNSGSGMLGNGVAVSSLDTDDYTFTLQPVPDDRVVWIEEVDQGGTTEYWFQYENGVDGSCDE